MNEIAWKIKCKEFNIILPHLSYFFMLVVKMSISCRTDTNIGYMLIWLINPLGAHKHTQGREKHNEETEIVRIDTFDKSCEKFCRLDKYLVPKDLIVKKMPSDKLAKEP